MNSSAFHNLTFPITSGGGTTSSATSSTSSRARTPAPNLPPRPRITTSSTSNGVSSNSYTSPLSPTTSYYDSYKPSSSRQSSVERSFLSDYNSNYGGASSDYGLRSRNSSPMRYTDTSDRYRTLPPSYPSGGGSSYDRFRREPSVESSYVQLRNRREGSQERFGSSRSSATPYSKARRSSFVDSATLPPKYY